MPYSLDSNSVNIGIALKLVLIELKVIPYTYAHLLLFRYSTLIQETFAIRNSDLPSSSFYCLFLIGVKK